MVRSIRRVTSERGLVLLTARLTTLCCQLSLNTQLISWGGVEVAPQSCSRHIGVPFEKERNQRTPCVLSLAFKVGFSVCLLVFKSTPTAKGIPEFPGE